MRNRVKYEFIIKYTEKIIAEIYSDITTCRDKSNAVVYKILRMHFIICKDNTK
jgi:hypothetical protein